MAIRGYYLGCPGWGDKNWVGRLFPTGTRPTEFLERYARVFNTVEGNTTFYALPTADTVRRWSDQVPDAFRFCFKFPRAISHDRLLLDGGAELATFLDRIAPLGARLGTLFLQLPPRFDAAQLPRLRAFLAGLPAGPRYAVEVRHDAFFSDGPEQRDLLAVLREHGADLVTMDTRGLHTGKSLALAEVRARKPNLPVRVRATADRPIVRCVPQEQFDASRGFVEPWAAQIARWIAEGKQPYFFMHAPDDTFAPENAYAFHAMVRRLADVGELPAWPGGERQLSLL
ncbi:MAG TPA: DUF72 domain-containing protein [Kofleriaceae bacterium]|jgi:uncharacterized protein YecE (DUF72 family)|nr:DUF72 domain-containing protein [Kofleriaceae bacterium]